MAVTRNARHVHEQANSSQSNQGTMDNEVVVESLNEPGNAKFTNSYILKDHA